MPWVDVVYKKGFSESTLNKLAEKLQEIVANALHVPSVKRANLSPNDVELFFREASPRDKCHSINILVHANDYPIRKDDIQERAARIAEEVDKIINWNAANPEKLHGIVYIPTMGGFAEF